MCELAGFFLDSTNVLAWKIWDTKANGKKLFDPTYEEEKIVVGFFFSEWNKQWNLQFLAKWTGQVTVLKVVNKTVKSVLNQSKKRFRNICIRRRWS